MMQLWNGSMENAAERLQDITYLFILQQIYEMCGNNPILTMRKSSGRLESLL